MKYSLVIKARSKDEAKEAAEDRGIVLLMMDKHPKHDEVIATAECKLITLQHWLNEDVGSEPPYPWGALLYFNKVKQHASRRAVQT